MSFDFLFSNPPTRLRTSSATFPSTCGIRISPVFLCRCETFRRHMGIRGSVIESRVHHVPRSAGLAGGSNRADTGRNSK